MMLRILLAGMRSYAGFVFDIKHWKIESGLNQNFAKETVIFRRASTGTPLLVAGRNR